MRYLEEIKRWLCEITEIFLLLVALGVVLAVLFGNAVPFFGEIMPNLTGLIASLGENGLVGLIALGVVVWLFRRSAAAHQPQHQQ
jgi:hypothetical protein